jgi:hypothetical protein
MASRGGRPSAALRVGSVVDAGRVTDIGWDAALGAYARVETPTRRPCYIAQWTPSSPADVPSAPEPPRAVASESRPAGAEIRQTGSSRFAVRRAVLDRIAADPSPLLRAVQTVPYVDNGRVAGVQLLESTPGSFEGNLGLQSGDVLTKINDRLMDAPGRWLETYTQLRSADHITLSILRNGQPLQIELDVSSRDPA